MNIGFFRCTSGFFVLAGALMLLGGAESFFIIIFAAAVHELGHIVTARVFGREVSSIKLTGVGAEMELRGGKMSYLCEIAIAASGSIASAVLALMAANFGVYFESMYYLAGVSMTFVVFNMLPVLPLDGGRVLYSLLSWIFSPQTADVICDGSSIAFSLSMVGLGILVLLKTKGNFTLLSAGIWLVVRHFWEKMN